MMTDRSHRAFRRQGGFSLFGMIFWAVAICMLAVLVLRVFPTVNEYFSIKTAINRIVQNRPGSVAEVRAAFDRQRQIEYSIASIEGNDLEVSINGHEVEISFAYDKEVEVFAPVYLLIKYRGSVHQN